MNSATVTDNAVFRLACMALCVAFLYSSISKLWNFDAALGEAAHFGLQPAWLYATGIIVAQLAGSLLVIFGSGRMQSLGAFGLAAFTAVATIIGHPFWKMTGMEQFQNRNSFLEHIGLIGGFVLVGYLAWATRARRT